MFAIYVLNWDVMMNFVAGCNDWQNVYDVYSVIIFQ